MKSNIPPPDVDTIVVDVNDDMCDMCTENDDMCDICTENDDMCDICTENDDMCDICTENSNVEEMSTEPMPESEDTSTAENHPFPANISHNSETRRKRKSGKSQALSQLLALEGRKIEQLEKAVQQKSILSAQEGEDHHFVMSLLPHLKDID